MEVSSPNESPSNIELAMPAASSRRSWKDFQLPRVQNTEAKEYSGKNGRNNNCDEHHNTKITRKVNMKVRTKLHMTTNRNLSNIC